MKSKIVPEQLQRGNIYSNE